ncbi:MAG: hypothetical protein IJI67_03325 [Clostridia bacterium]|nr:hypothetical protein [Clostridia bacterium]
MKTLNLLLFGGESTAPAEAISAAAEESSATEGVGTRETAESGEPSASAATAPADARSEEEQQPDSYRQFKEQFKEQYQADLQRVIDKRFKNAKKVEAQRDALQTENERYHTLLAALEERYGTKDLDELCSRMTQTAPTAPAGQGEEVTPPADLPPAQQESKDAAALQQQIVEQWQQEAADLIELYPAFSLENELDNEKFSAALQSGMSVRDAYQYAHFDEILGGVIAYTAQNVKEAVSDARNQRMARPVENGTRAGAAAIVKSDVSKLSKQEMEDIDRRVLRGERISF